MKNLVLTLLLLLSVTTFAQKKRNSASRAAATAASNDTIVKDSIKLTPYVGVGLSMSSGNTYDSNEDKKSFRQSVFPSIELGVSQENVSVGLVLGRGDLLKKTDKFYDISSQSYQDYESDRLSHYFWELKVTPSFKMGKVTGTILFGGGSYFAKTNAFFIEYGSGISYSVGNIAYGITYSNWDGNDYITPSVTYNFN